jgi:hypothetical protein
MLRVLEPGGLVAIRSQDWGGFIVEPEISVFSHDRHFTGARTSNAELDGL